MDKRGLITIIVILIGGILLGKHWDVFSIRDKGKVLNMSSLNDKEESENRSPVIPGKSAGYLQNSFADVVKKIKPSLVNISAVHIVEIQTPFYHFYFGDPFEDFFDDFFGRSKRRRIPKKETEKYRYEGTGSGFIVDPKGYVLTNYHVIKNADEIKITTYDDKKYTAKVVGKDPRTDLAVVKIKSFKKFNALKMGDSSTVEIGNWVIAAGSPFGLNQTYTAGIISAVRQNVHVENNVYMDMIQTDAAINKGNSGGPLVNMKGEVIGINTAIYAPTGVFSGVGFALPINPAKKVLYELIEKGRVVRGWLGIGIMNVDDAIKEQFGLKSAKGVLINRIFEDSQAQKGGLERGDIIVGFNDKKIKDVHALQELVSISKPGKKVKLTIIREGAEKILEIKLGEMPDEFPADKKGAEEKKKKGESRWKGIGVSNITEITKEKYNLSLSVGVVVVEVDPGEEGYDIGLHIGDVIAEINKSKIGNVEDFDKAVKKVNLKIGVLFDIIRNGIPLYVSYQSSR